MNACSVQWPAAQKQFLSQKHPWQPLYPCLIRVRPASFWLCFLSQNHPRQPLLCPCCVDSCSTLRHFSSLFPPLCRVAKDRTRSRSLPRAPSSCVAFSLAEVPRVGVFDGARGGVFHPGVPHVEVPDQARRQDVAHRVSLPCYSFSPFNEGEREGGKGGGVGGREGARRAGSGIAIPSGVARRTPSYVQAITLRLFSPV